MRARVLFGLVVIAGVLATCASCATAGHPPSGSPAGPVEATVREGSFVPGLVSVFALNRIDAVTIGRTVYVRPGRLDAWMRRHELEHVRQWEKHGVTFPFRYLLAVVLPGNRFEEAADSAARVLP